MRRSWIWLEPALWILFLGVGSLLTDWVFTKVVGMIGLVLWGVVLGLRLHDRWSE